MPVMKNLRKLYGRSSPGSRSREIVRATITEDTMDKVRSIVEVKKGGQGSAFIELSIRLMIALLSVPSENTPFDEMEYIATEIEYSVNSPYFVSNMEKLARLLRA